MLSQRDNDTPLPGGPGTPMGELFRRFWLPAMLSSELPEPDCAPVRLKLLGENLVAFRDSEGRVGVVDNFCPHRRASLFFGRNEEGGLRCVYHGWKFDVNGDCVDMPSEPAESNFKDKVKVRSYAAEDFGDVIWIYMGPPELKQPLPQYEWARVPANQRRVQRWIQDCNYMQALEGDLDSTHVSFLHRWMDPDQATPWDPQQRQRRRTTASGQALLYREGAPKFSVMETDFGMVYGARRPAATKGTTGGVTNFFMPVVTMPPQPTAWFGHAWVPVDDEHMSCLAFSWNPNEPMNTPSGSNNGNIQLERVAMDDAGRLHHRHVAGRAAGDERLRHRPAAAEDGQLHGNRAAADAGREVNETQGWISDRTKEHLGTTDLAIIAARRMLLRMARELQEGVEPTAVQQGDLYHVRAIDVVTEESTLPGVLEKHVDIATATV